MTTEINVTWSHSVSLDRYHGVFHEQSKAASYSSFIIAIAEIVSWWLLTLEAWVWSQCNPFGIWVGHNGSETGFSPNTYYYTSVPFSYSHLPLTLCILDTNTETIQDFITKDVPIKCDNFQIAFLMNWNEYKKQK